MPGRLVPHHDNGGSAIKYHVLDDDVHSDHFVLIKPVDCCTDHQCTRQHVHVLTDDEYAALAADANKWRTLSPRAHELIADLLTIGYDIGSCSGTTPAGD